MQSKLRCWCREAGHCECKPECFPQVNQFDCSCIEAGWSVFDCNCIMEPASTANSPAYLIGKDERQFNP